MRYVKGLRWKMLALMLVGTILIYIDRNVLGVLAPILKKELNFTTEAIFLRRLVVPDRLLILPAGRGLSDRSHRSAHRLCGRRVRLGTGRRAARLLDRMDFDGRLPRACSAFPRPSPCRPAQRPRPCGSPPHERSIATGWFNSGSSIGAALTPPVVIWLSQRLRLAVRLPAHRPAGGRVLRPLVLALSRPAEPSAPVAGRVHPDRGRPDEGRGGKARAQEDLRSEELHRPDHRPLPHRARLADLRLLDPAVHGLRARHGHQAVRAVRLAAVPGLGHRLPVRRLSRAVPAQAFGLGRSFRRGSP